MSESMIEIILLVLFVFFVGCILGYIFHRLIARSPKGQTPAEAYEALDAADAEGKPEALKMAELKVPTGPAQAPQFLDSIEQSRTGNGTQPKGLPTPRGGSPDPLQRISGVGPKIESRLHDLGIFHFDQIAAWSEEQELWVDGYLKFKGRIGRDEWVQQARLLAQGREEEFASRYGVAEKKGSRSRRAPQR